MPFHELPVVNLGVDEGPALESETESRRQRHRADAPSRGRHLLTRQIGRRRDRHEIAPMRLGEHVYMLAGRIVQTQDQQVPAGVPGAVERLPVGPLCDGQVLASDSSRRCCMLGSVGEEPHDATGRFDEQHALGAVLWRRRDGGRTELDGRKRLPGRLFVGISSVVADHAALLSIVILGLPGVYLEVGRSSARSVSSLRPRHGRRPDDGAQVSDGRIRIRINGWMYG